MVAPRDFFADPKWASIAKVEILQKYLRPFSYKLGSRSSRLWLVDGFAGAGAYQPDTEGHSQDGSPRVAAKLARELELKRGDPLLRTINVEADHRTFGELSRNLAPYQHLVTNYLRTFEESLEDILKIVGRDPALFFLDPFGRELRFRRP